MTTPNEPNPYELPQDLPVPLDDGACDHLPGTVVPEVTLRGTDDQIWNLGELARVRAVVYVYPATGVPGKDPIPGWDDIPGAPGCTVQSLGFRDRHADFAALGIRVFGLSAQPTDEQKEFLQRTKVPFVLLSDPDLQVRRTLGLPVFEAHGRTFYRRLAMLFESGRVSKVFYPVFPPNKSAESVLAWLQGPA